MHKTMIGGTAYGISGGKTMIDGTAYSIKGGKTMVDGTAYSITFSTDCVVTVTGEGQYTNTNRMYIEIPAGISTAIVTTAGSYTIQRGDEVKAAVRGRSYYIILNDVEVATGSATKTTTYTFAAESDIAVFFGKLNGKTGVHITTT